MKKFLSIMSLILMLLIVGCGNINIPGGNNGGNIEEPECVHTADLEKYFNDASNHWHLCSKCDATLDVRPHEFTSWSIVIEPSLGV